MPSIGEFCLSATQGNNSRSLKCDSRQIAQASTSDPDREVPVSGCVQYIVLQIGRATNRTFCYPVQPQTSKVCITRTGSDSLGVDTLSLHWENLDIYTFRLMSVLSKVVSKVMDQGCRRMILITPGWPNMS